MYFLFSSCVKKNETTSIQNKQKTSGIDQLSLFGYSSQNDFSRLGLNMQHLLKTESKFDQIIDPLAGAFSIEKACAELGSLVWSKL